MMSSDFQEAKNIDTQGSKIMPNTRTGSATVHVVPGVTADWLLSRCTQLAVTAGSPRGIVAVRFTVDGRRVATTRRSVQGIWTARAHLTRGRHVLVATAVDGKGVSASAQRQVRTCSA
jgi:hypothetical protein